jgi:hypothetical protein
MELARLELPRRAPFAARVAARKSGSGGSQGHLTVSKRDRSGVIPEHWPRRVFSYGSQTESGDTPKGETAFVS